MIQKLSVQNIRSHTSTVVEFGTGASVIIGPNGAGKTSLLEALYIAYQGSSFKGSSDDIVRRDAPWWRIDVLESDDSRRSVTYDPSLPSAKKKFDIEGVKSARLVPKHRRPVVLFEPDDLRLLHGSPSRRRQFIDRFVAQINPLYQTSLRKYERALKQRNNLLKQDNINNDELFAWNVALAEYGAYVINQRIAFVEKINAVLDDEYRHIAGVGDLVSVHYSNTTIDYTKEKMLRELESAFSRDVILGYTSIGPHRHDLVFTYAGSDALKVASRGEIRSIILALKFIEVDIVRDLAGLDPIVLLDDVFSELDESRQKRLLTGSSQVILTSVSVPSGVPVENVIKLG